MFTEILTNPTIIGSIIGAIVGAIASATFALIISRYKFNKRKNGANALIKSEINHILDVLEKFKEKYLKEEIKIEKNKRYPEVFNFYNMMPNFPIWTNQNWINLINFIPSIFKEEEINKITNFYAKCEEITDAAKTLADKEPYNKISIGGQPTGKIPMPSKDINNDRNMFRKDLNELIEMGNEVKEIFE